mgnify:CR=1 FL=1
MILRRVMFESSVGLIEYVNRYGIEQKDIQAIISDDRKYVLFYWEEV